jgi:hypothetical protein
MYVCMHVCMRWRRTFRGLTACVLPLVKHAQESFRHVSVHVHVSVRMYVWMDEKWVDTVRGVETREPQVHMHVRLYCLNVCMHACTLNV